jgi:hypothetical protein
MKSSTGISVIALVTSVAAVVLSLTAIRHHSESRIQAIVDARLSERELRFVEAYAPHFREMFGSAEALEAGDEWQPKSLEELFAPIVEITRGMSSGD